MNIRTVRAGAISSVIVALMGCSSDGISVATEPEPGSSHDSFSTTPDEPNHEEVTAEALSFLRPDVLTALQVANVATDAEFVLVNANHFDDCNFTGGSAVVRSSQAEAVSWLDPSAVTPETDLAAIRAFARSLHALQDFYAHTNWVELGGSTLVDESLGAFPELRPYSVVPSSGFVIVQGEKKPRRAALSRDELAPYPESAIVKVKLGRAWSPGLISGTVDYEEGDFCPPSVAMTHDELNKDKSSIAERQAQHVAARALAVQQTEHEWCRLRALTDARWGAAGTSRLDSWVAAGVTAPACQ